MLNDVDGGMPYWNGRNQPDGSVAVTIEAVSLLEILERNRVIGLKTDPAKKERFQKEVLGRITESSHPVIMRIGKQYQ